VVAGATAATAPKIPPHPAISKRTSCLRICPRAAGVAQTPPTPTTTKTTTSITTGALRAHMQHQKAWGSLVSSGPRTNLGTTRLLRRKPTHLSTPKDGPNRHSHPTATKQPTLLGRCRVPPTPTPTQTCRVKGRPLPPSMAEAMVVKVQTLPARHKPLLPEPRRPEHPYPPAPTPTSLV
jgi:hypothetical protein